MPKPETLTHVLTFDELSQAWLGMMDGTLNLSGQAVDEGVRTWRHSPEFCGMSEADMRLAIDHGYVVPGMELGRGSQMRPRRKARLSEDEGELQIDLALGGHDRPFLNRPRVKRQAGLKINFELAVTAMTPASVLADYAQWMGSLVAGLQGRDFDLEINVVSRAKAVGAKGEHADVTVRVKRFGKRSDLKSWGAMLSPGGFRMLIFAGRILTCHANKRECSGGFGGSYGPAWGLEFDAKTRTLTVKCAAKGAKFPKDLLDAQLADLSL